jgi:hypothetical protein
VIRQSSARYSGSPRLRESRKQSEPVKSQTRFTSFLGVTLGYSGRDSSIIEALTEAIDSGRGFPGGLFWFRRSGELPYHAVSDLMSKAKRAGVDAHLIEVETFDELFSDIVRFLPETERAAQSIQDAARPRLAKAALRIARSSTPAVRTNALPVTSYPAVCRLVVCEIGG